MSVMTIYEQIQRALDFIEENLCLPPSQKDAAFQAGMSSRGFQDYFWKVTGFTFKEYVCRRRLCRALSFLRETDRQILSVALETGYQSHEAFSRAFKKEFSVSPLQYKQNRPGLKGLFKLQLYKEMYMGVIVKELKEMSVACFDGFKPEPEFSARKTMEEWARENGVDLKSRRIFGHNIKENGEIDSNPENVGYRFMVSLLPEEKFENSKMIVPGKFVVTGIEGPHSVTDDGAWIGEGWARLNQMVEQKGYRVKSPVRWFEEELEPSTPGNLRMDLYLEIE